MADTIETLLADIEAARTRLRRAVQRPPSWAIDPDPSSDWPGCKDDDVAPEYADLRGESIPELPEAAVREQIPYVADMTDRDGRQKVVLQAVPQGSDLVQRFMAGEIVPGLIDCYGDPARGFAGGYLA